MSEGKLAANPVISPDGNLFLRGVFMAAKRKTKSWEELTFADNYMFTRVMRNLDECKHLLEILLKIKITEITIPEAESTLAASYEAKSIRLDVRTSDPEHEYDIEMQTTNETSLPLRARYYQSLMDIEATQRRTKYKNLKQNVVIFICLKDPFGEDRPVYTIKNICMEKPETKYDDKMIKVFYNCAACDKMEDEETRAFLKYVATKKSTTAYTSRLDKLVEELKVTPREQLYYNNWLDITDEIREEAREEGREEGAQANAIENARNLLRLGVAEETVSQGCSLPLEQVIALKDELKVEN